MFRNLVLKSLIGFAFIGTRVLANECEKIQQFLISANYTLDTVTNCIEDKDGSVISL